MKYGRNTDGTFSAGNSGKPKGSRNLRKVAIESLLGGQAGALTQKAILKVPEGDGVNDFSGVSATFGHGKLDLASALSRVGTLAIK